MAEPDLTKYDDVSLIGLGIIFAMGGIVEEQTGKDVDPTKLLGC